MSKKIKGWCKDDVGRGVQLGEEVNDANIRWRSQREASKDSGSGVPSSCFMIVITVIVMVMTPNFFEGKRKIFFHLLLPVLLFETRRVLGKTLIVQPQRAGPLLVGIINMSSIVSIAIMMVMSMLLMTYGKTVGLFFSEEPELSWPGMQIADCRLQNVDSRLWIADCNTQQLCQL